MARLLLTFALCGAMIAAPAAAQDGTAETAPSGATALPLVPPGPNDMPAARTPAASEKPVAEPAPAANDKPVTEAPAPAPEQNPVTEVVPPVPKEPVVEAPQPIPEQKPVAEAPPPAPEQKPVVEGPPPAPEQKPVVEAPRPAPPEKSVVETPSPVPAEKPVVESKPAETQPTPPPAQPSATAESKPEPEGRFSFNRVNDGFLRLDIRTGQVSFCSKRSVGWTCQLAPEDRGALEGEITRLEEENANLKKELLARGLPVPNDVAKAEPPAAKNGETYRHPTDPNLERMKVLVEEAWRRLVDMITTFQKDVLKKS